MWGRGFAHSSLTRYRSFGRDVGINTVVTSDKGFDGSELGLDLTELV